MSAFLRQRVKPSSATTSASAAPEKSANSLEKTGTNRDMDAFAAYLESVSGKVPTFARASYVTAIPYIVSVVKAFENSLPMFEYAYNEFILLKTQLAPYHLELLFPSFFGLIICFFGGDFVTLVAAVEAYRQIGYEQTVKSINDLISDYKLLSAANVADNKKDDDHDGIADVNEISKEQLLMRKTLLFLRTIDPIKVQGALLGIQTGFLAVIATLKMHFAKAITLGNSIAEVLDVLSNKYVVPVIRDALPDEYEQWAVALVGYTIRAFSISIAWTLERFISTFHSSIRGGLMFSRNVMEYTTLTGIYKIDHEESIIDEIVGYALALLGFLFQVSTGFSLPFPLNILLFPFTILEYVLMYFVGVSP